MKLQRQFTDGKCTHMRVIHTGTHPEQNFSQRLIAEGLAEGWAKVIGNKLELATDGEPLAYTVNREPGYYAADGSRIPISNMAWGMALSGQTQPARAEALAWLASHDKPSDYEINLSFMCVLDAAQHEQFKAEA